MESTALPPVEILLATPRYRRKRPVRADFNTANSLATFLTATCSADPSRFGDNRKFEIQPKASAGGVYDKKSPLLADCEFRFGRQNEPVQALVRFL
jgi:hypothetical protein